MNHSSVAPPAGQQAASTQPIGTKQRLHFLVHDGELRFGRQAAAALLHLLIPQFHLLNVQSRRPAEARVTVCERRTDACMRACLCVHARMHVCVCLWGGVFNSRAKPVSLHQNKPRLVGHFDSTWYWPCCPTSTPVSHHPAEGQELWLLSQWSVCEWWWPWIRLSASLVDAVCVHQPFPLTTMSPVTFPVA